MFLSRVKTVSSLADINRAQALKADNPIKHTDGILSLETASRARTGLGYEIVTLRTGQYMSVKNNSTSSMEITKISSNNNWNGEVVSEQNYSAPVTMEFFKRAADNGGDNGNSYLVIGWNTTPYQDTGNNNIDHAAYPYRQDTYYVRDNGSQTSYASWDQNKKFYLTYTIDGQIQHWNGDTLLYSANYDPGTVYIDTSFYSTDNTYSTLREFRVIRAEWNGSSYV